MFDAAQKFLVIRGRTIAVDETGRVSLNDIHRAAGFTKNQKPSDWTRLPATSRLVEEVLKRNTGKSRNWAKNEFRTALYSKPGYSGGTFADARLALAYAEYLNPKLAVEVREVFLRYKAADATLADDILQRAPAADNEWAGVRALGRAARNQLTGVLKDHGVAKSVEYARVTNSTYTALLGKNASQLRESKGLGPKDNLRDSMETKELGFLTAAELLAKERIEDEDVRGVVRCSSAAEKSATFIRRAIEADRADRKKKI
ncbi:MAG TPA: KilA-N domain-containing protein [Roseiarcus sp.]|nr:KilA-N domain-containing protein [Roseiarcus sp.]